MSCFNRTVDGQPMPDVTAREILSELPSDWRQFHRDNVAKLDPEKVENACTFLRGWFADGMDAVQVHELTEAIKVNPEWFTAHHFFGMMAVRNALRIHGFGEKCFGIDNLDDYAVGLVERAFGI